VVVAEVFTLQHLGWTSDLEAMRVEGQKMGAATPTGGGGGSSPSDGVSFFLQDAIRGGDHPPAVQIFGRPASWAGMEKGQPNLFFNTLK
jgi:hypothetical protein